MKRRRQEIQIFNLSAIDLFACTMAAFLMIAIVLLPHYGKNNLPLRQAREGQAKAQAEAAKQQKAKEDAEVKLGLGTMVFVMVATPQTTDLQNVPGLPFKPNIGYAVYDADLIIEIPSGELIWHGNRGTRETGIIGFDAPMAEGANIYTAHNPKPGKYRVWVNLQSIDERTVGQARIRYEFNAIFPRARYDAEGILTDAQLNPGYSTPPAERGRILVVEFELSEKLDANIIFGQR